MKDVIARVTKLPLESIRNLSPGDDRPVRHGIDAFDLSVKIFLDTPPSIA